MTETFRQASDADRPALAELARHSFPGAGHSSGEWEGLLWAGPHGGLEDLWVGEDSGRPVAVCQLLPLRQYIAGAVIRTMGLGAVAVAPTHRRRGLADRLVTSGLRRARERGDVASALYPFRASFYGKLGYGLAGEAEQWDLPPGLLPDSPHRKAVRLAVSSADRTAVRGVYDRWARERNGQMLRSERAWSKVWDGDDRGVLVVDGESGGEPEGYAVFRSVLDGPEEERRLEVEEWAWLSARGRDALTGWLSSVGDQWRRVLCRTHPEHRFGERLREARPPARTPGWGLWFPTATRMRGPMFRLLNAEEAFAARRFADVDLAVGLQIADLRIPENDGAWRLSVEGGTASIERNGASTGTLLRFGMDTLSRLYIGDLTPSGAVTLGHAEIDGPGALAALDALFRTERPWTFDRF